MTNEAAEQRYQTLANLLVGQTSAELVQNEAEWIELLALAQGERADPLLHRMVSALPVTSMPDIVSELLSTTYTDVVRSSLVHESTRARLCRQLSSRQIPVLLLKGSALAFTYYDDPATRVMKDLDILVPAARREEAADCLEGAGFGFASGSRAAELRCARSHAVCIHSTTGITVELHWELKGLGSRRAGALEEIWSGARPAGFEPMALVMREGHLIPYLCAHMAVQHKYAPLLGLYDLHRVLLKIDPAEAEVTKDAAIRWGLASCVGLVLRRVQQLFGTLLPYGLETWSLGAAAQNDLQARVAALVLTPGATGLPHPQWLDLVTGQNEQSWFSFLFPPLASVRRQLGLSRNALVPPTAYLAIMARRLRRAPAHLHRFYTFGRAARGQGSNGMQGDLDNRAALPLGTEKTD